MEDKAHKAARRNLVRVRIASSANADCLAEKKEHARGAEGLTFEEHYERLEKKPLGEGTYGEVARAGHRVQGTAFRIFCIHPLSERGL